MKKALYGSLIASIFLLAIACKKDNDNPPGPSKTDHLTSSSWRFDKATASGFDVSSQVDPCYKDNIVTFSSNLTGTINESTIVCNPPAPPTFTWSFNSDETILILSSALFQGGSGNFNIVTLNETNLVVSQQMTINGTTTTVVITFKH